VLARQTALSFAQAVTVQESDGLIQLLNGPLVCLFDSAKHHTKHHTKTAVTMMLWESDVLAKHLSVRPSAVFHLYLSLLSNYNNRAGEGT
jgi:hypothetical protein